MKTITLTNDFHATSINLRIAENGILSDRQVKKAKKALCCSDCLCSGRLGIRGHQEGFEILNNYDYDRRGEIYSVAFDEPNIAENI